jgi:hypothetical protein
MLDAVVLRCLRSVKLHERDPTGPTSAENSGALTQGGGCHQCGVLATLTLVPVRLVGSMEPPTVSDQHLKPLPPHSIAPVKELPKVTLRRTKNSGETCFGVWRVNGELQMSGPGDMLGPARSSSLAVNHFDILIMERT